jgi:hypothetical protein
MSRRGAGLGLARLLALLVLLASGACRALPAQGGAEEAAASRQVLVMLRMPAPHFRAGADAGGYGAGAGSDPGRAARRRTAQALAREHSLRIVDDWPMPVVGVDCYLMEGPPGAGPSLLSALARDPRVAWAQPVNLFHGMGLAQQAADPLAPLQPDTRFWHSDELHRVSLGDGVRVAVVDSGVDSRHPDLAQQIELRENFVGEGDSLPEAHGTAVAGVIAARMGNGLGIAGVAPGARLLALRACWETAGTDGAQGARCSSFTLAKALNFAVLHDARVINLSLSGPADRLLQTLVRAAGQARRSSARRIRRGPMASLPRSRGYWRWRCRPPAAPCQRPRCWRREPTCRPACRARAGASSPAVPTRRPRSAAWWRCWHSGCRTPGPASCAVTLLPALVPPRWSGTATVAPSPHPALPSMPAQALRAPPAPVSAHATPSTS